MDNNGETFIISLKDGGPWGFRLEGGMEHGCPLQVAKLRVNSKAYKAGLQEADIITKVNGQDISAATHSYARQAIEHGGDNIDITVIRGAKSIEDLYQKFLREHQENKAKDHRNVSRASINLSREPSPSRTLHVLRRSQPREHTGVSRAATLLTVSSPNSQAEYKTFTSAHGRKYPEAPEQAKPTRPPPPPTFTPSVRSASLPRTLPGNERFSESGTNMSSNLGTLYVDVTNSLASHKNQQSPSFAFNRGSTSQPIVVPIKPMEIPRPHRSIVEFKVRNINAPSDVWRPTQTRSSMLSVDENQGSFNTHTPSADRDKTIEKKPCTFYWELMANQPPHMPGYVDPLIVDDTQGDFGGNPLINREKKVYADSNFFDTKDDLYPTIPEQMKLCKMISGILEAPDAMRSRGGKMFFKRKQKAEEWSKEAMGRKFEKPYDDGDEDFFDPEGNHYWPSTIKDSLTHDELERLEHNTQVKSKHDLLPPVVAFDINSALKRSRNHGKGVDIFNYYKERAEQHVVDENNRRTVGHSNKLETQVQQFEDFQQYYKSPWTAAVEGNVERAFATIDPCATRSCMAEPALRKDENPHNVNFNHLDASFAVKYKDYAKVKAPTGPKQVKNNFSQSTSALDKLNLNLKQPRLLKMISAKDDAKTTYDTYTYKWCMPSYYGQEELGSQEHVHLRRPKDYMRTISSSTDDVFYEEPDFDPYMSPSMMNLRRPRDYLNKNDGATASVNYPTQHNVLVSPRTTRVLTPAHDLERPISAF